jgi:hypothetical protein
VSTGNLSSSTKTISDTQIVNDISDDGTSIQDSLDTVLDGEGVNSLITITDI